MNEVMSEVVEAVRDNLDRRRKVDPTATAVRNAINEDGAMRLYFAIVHAYTEAIMVDPERATDEVMSELESAIYLLRKAYGI